MKSTPKLIVFHPSFYKPTSPSHRLWLLAFSTLSTLTLLLTLLNSNSPPSPPPSNTINPHLTTTLSAALLHFATASAANSTVASNDRMTAAELNSVAMAIRECSRNCNVLVFGFTHETLLWKALNDGGGRRTVFVDENEYVVSKYEKEFSDIEAYDVQYITKVSKWKEMIDYARVHRKDDCKPTQNLLFSDCKLAVNDLPNHLYSIHWDIILIDGPRGYSGKMPGRMAPIFTAAVMARTPTTDGPNMSKQQTHVFVHDYGREIEKVYSEEFLCKENLVAVNDNLGHFVVKERDENDDRFFEFCKGESFSSSS